MLPVIAVVLLTIGFAGLGYTFALVLNLGARPTLRDLLAVKEQPDATQKRPVKIDSRQVVPQVAGMAMGAMVALVVFSAAPMILGLCTLAGGILLPKAYKRLVLDRERERLHRLMPEALTTMAAALRAGRNLPQAVEEAAARTPEPLGQYFRDAHKDLIGNKDEDAVFEALHTRLGFEATEMLASAVKALNAMGGKWAETFDTIADLARSREAARAEAKAGRAEPMLVMYFMAALPAGVMTIIQAVDPLYYEPVLSTFAGQVQVLVLVLGMPAFGLYVARRLLTAGGDGL